MKKVLYFGILSLMILIAIVAFWNPRVDRVEDEPVVDFSEITVPVDPQAESLQLKTREGNITVRNFIDDPRTYVDTVNDGYYQLGYFVDPTTPVPPDVPFSIEFISGTQHFIVVLMQEDVAAARRQAEQFLLAHLGVSEAQLCDLSYIVSVPERFSSPYTGQDLRFSFCDDAVLLP